MTAASFNGGLLNEGRFVPLRCSDRSVLELASSPAVGHAEIGESLFSVSDESPSRRSSPLQITRKLSARPLG
jgi:hypothetical protein